MKGFNTTAIHGDATSNQKKDIHHALRVPVYDSAAYEFDSAEQIADSFQGKIVAYQYSRSSNPTVAELETRLCQISNATSAICVSSGMSAVSNTILTLCGMGDNIVTTKYLFGNTYAFFASTLKKFGIEARFIDFDDLQALEDNIDSRTRCVFLETISNPHLFIYDYDAISAITRKHGVVLAIDNTLPTPYLFKSSQHGVDIEILSNTKAISGGATSIGGSILTYPSQVWAQNPYLQDFFIRFGQMAFLKLLRSTIYRDTGTCLSPHNAFLQLLGIETLSLRIEKACSNANAIAEYLNKHPEITKSYYPMLNDGRDKENAVKYLHSKPCSMLTFELESQQACFTFLNNLQIIRRATNLCDNKSLIIHPYSTIYQEYSESLRAEMKINDRMIRFSVGIEDVEDIIADIEQSLNKLC